MSLKQNSHKAIVFNGPPNSGKDYAALFLTIYDKENVIHLKFKDKLYELTACVYGFSDTPEKMSEFMELCTDRELKDKPSNLFGGLSPRQALIKVSEDVIKPIYGKRYFGNALANKMKSISASNPDKDLTFVVSDSGFVEELEPVAESIDVVFVQIHRDGCDYSNDSRSYIDPIKEEIPIIDFWSIHNSGDENFLSNILDIYKLHKRKGNRV